MGFPPTCGWMRELPAASGQARRRSAAARASSSASSSVVKNPGRFTWNISLVGLGCSTWNRPSSSADYRDERPAAFEVALALGKLGEGVCGGEHEHPAARTDEPCP